MGRARLAFSDRIRRDAGKLAFSNGRESVKATASSLLVAQYKIKAVVEGKRNRFMAVVAVTAAPLHTTPPPQRDDTLFSVTFSKNNLSR